MFCKSRVFFLLIVLGWISPVSAHFCVDVYGGLPRLIISPQKMQAQELMKWAIQAKRIGEEKQGALWAEQALEINPFYFKAQEFLGLYFFKIGEFEKASSYFEFAHQNPKQGYKISQRLIDTYERLGRKQSQLAAIERALELQPGKVTLVYQRVEVLIALGQAHMARTYFVGLKGRLTQNQVNSIAELEVSLLRAEGRFEKALEIVNSKLSGEVKKLQNFKWEIEKLNILEKLEDTREQIRQIQQLLTYKVSEVADILLGKQVLLLVKLAESAKRIEQRKKLFDTALQRLQILKQMVEDAPDAVKLSTVVSKLEAQVLFRSGDMRAAEAVLKKLSRKLDEPDYLVIAALMKIERSGQKGPNYEYSPFIDAVLGLLKPKELKKLIELDKELFWSFEAPPLEAGQFVISHSFWSNTVYFNQPIDGNAVNISKGTLLHR